MTIWNGKRYPIVEKDIVVKAMSCIDIDAKELPVITKAVPLDSHS